MRLVLAGAGIAVALGVGGCQLFPRAAQWAHVTPPPAMPRAIVAPSAAPPRTAQTIDDALYARATEAIRQRNYAMALEVLAIARERRANDARILTAMGVVYDKLGRFDLSGRYYQLAETADPGSKIVAADQAYSARLRQMAEAGQPRQPIVDAPQTIPAQLASLGPAPILASAAGTLRVGHPLEVQNASGELAASTQVRAQLARKGWRVAAVGAAPVSPATVLRFPASDARVAYGLRATLKIPVRLEPCADCDRLELVLGRDVVGAFNPTKQRARA